MFLKDLPTLEMWMQFSSATTGHDAFLVDAVMTLGEIATKEVFEWIDSRPEVINNYKLITRLLDDIATFKVCQITIRSIIEWPYLLIILLCP